MHMQLILTIINCTQNNAALQNVSMVTVKNLILCCLGRNIHMRSVGHFKNTNDSHVTRV